MKHDPHLRLRDYFVPRHGPAGGHLPRKTRLLAAASVGGARSISIVTAASLNVTCGRPDLARKLALNWGCANRGEDGRRLGGRNGRRASRQAFKVGPHNVGDAADPGIFPQLP